jgi:hypothetical protein
MSNQRHDMVKAAAANIELDGSRMTALAVAMEMKDLFPKSLGLPTSRETGQMLRYCGYHAARKERDKRSRTTVTVYEKVKE